MIMIMDKIVTILLSLLLYGCYMPSYLRLEDTCRREIKMVCLDGRPYIQISGLCGHSALGVDKFITVTNNNIMTIKITMKSKGHGTFDKKIEIPDGVSMIYWGDALIWKNNKVVK